jgi:hypothetical protein
VLALGYKLFQAWLATDPLPETEAAPQADSESKSSIL